ncbi:MAG: PilZ domain-containing protein [Pseudomonadota bacterium]
MTTQDMINRREAHRAAVAFDLTVEAESEVGHQFYSGLIKDMSSGGLFIATRDYLPAIGERFVLRFAFPPVVVEPVEVTVVVRWQRIDPYNPDYPPGVGVQFVDLAADLAAKIGTYVKDKDTLLWDDDVYSEWGETDA